MKSESVETALPPLPGVRIEEKTVDLSALLELQASLLNYSVQTLSPRHHRLATTVFYSGSHQLVHLEHKELERTDVKKRKTMLSETTNLTGLAWPSITTQMHHYSFKFFHAGTFDQSSTPSEMQHVKIFTSVRSITAQSVTNSRWP